MQATPVVQNRRCGTPPCYQTHPPTRGDSYQYHLPIFFYSTGSRSLFGSGVSRVGRRIAGQNPGRPGIPAHNQGPGKVQFTLQDRLVEYDAVTSGEALPTGTKIFIVSVVGSDTVAVAPIAETQTITK